MYLPFHVHTNYSILDGNARIKDLPKRLSSYDIGSCMITDHRSMGGCVEFNETLNKNKIKPIIGNEFDITLGSAADKTPLNKKTHHMVICATNKNGYKNLCNLTSISNNEDFYYYKARIDLHTLEKEDTSDLLFFTGHFGSLLHSIIEQVPTVDQFDTGVNFINRLASIVGKDNLYMEIQRLCCPDDDYSDLITRIAHRCGIKTTACIDAHVIDKKDLDNQRLLLASSLGTTLKKYKTKLKDNPLMSFFTEDYYYIPSPEEMKKLHTDEELKHSMEISDRCESYDLTGPPILPKFCENEKEELMKLCESGWKNILENRGVLNDNNRETYRNRLDYEFGVINEFGLAGYFLIVKDFIDFAKNNGKLAIPRGSAGSSLVSYLAGITYTDPIPNKLIFTRFLNKGRFTKNKVEYPDIDVDFESYFGEEVVEYIRNKYGRDKVAQICNYGTLKGSGALKEVLRMQEACSYSEMNEMTKNIPEESAISDQLEEQQEDSILMFTLKNMPAVLENYVKLENGKIQGSMAQYFKQAVEIEGAIKNQGIHAAGLVISPTPLAEICPLSRSKDGNVVTSYDMNSAKKIGLIKFDILKVSVLDKLNYVNHLLGK